MELRGKATVYAKQEIPDDVWNKMTSKDLDNAIRRLYEFLTIGAANFNYGGDPADDKIYDVWFDID